MNTSRQHEGRSQSRGGDHRCAGKNHRRTSVNRRGFISTLATGATGLVSGCLSEHIRTEQTDTSDGWVTAFPGRLNDFDPLDPDTTLGRFMYDVGFVPDPRTGERTFVLASDVEETASHVSITLQPNVMWSNGDPLTAADIGRWTYMYRVGSSALRPISEIRDGSSRPRTAWEAITDVKWDNRTLTVEGVFDEAPSPLFELNTYLGSRPRAHYDQLWEAFQERLDDSDRDDSSRTNGRTFVDENAWYLGEEYRPEAGIHLEADYDGAGREAAFSGLWYPTRIENGRLEFSINDTHPFADRVSFETVYWEFQGERASPVPALRSGNLDGVRLEDVPESLLESLPASIDSFDGAPRAIITMTVNHSISALHRRDVRAALMYLLDRDAIAESVNLTTRRSIDVPGADLQRPKWIPDELREAMRSYEYDPDRAKTLLERAGFQYEDGWKTPDGETFEIELLADDSSPTLQYAIESQLSSFGIAANTTILESTSYQTHLEDEIFIATDNRFSSPNAAGRRRTRAGDYVRTVTAGNGYQDSSFLEREIEAALTQRGDLSWAQQEPWGASDVATHSLAFDDLDALQSITVQAPPYGEPNEPVREWPYLYHAVRAVWAHDLTETIEHARRCSWIYNYVVPELELLVEVPRVFHDTTRWTIPSSDDPVWDHVGIGRHPGDLWAAMGWGHIDQT